MIISLKFNGTFAIFIIICINNDFICCCLNFGEFAIFNLKSVINIDIPVEEELQNLNINNKKKVDKLKISSRFYLPEKKAICTFSNFMEDEIEKEYITCIGTKGNYYLVKFDKDKNDSLAEKVCEKYFLKSDS